LTQVGLDPISSVVEDVARHLNMGQLGVLPLAMQMLPLIEKALVDVQMGIEPQSEKIQEDWLHWATQFPSSDANQDAGLALFSSSAAQTVAGQQRIDHVAKPSASTKHRPLTELPRNTSNHDGVPLKVTSQAAEHEWGAIRLKGLRLLQQARIVNQQDDERSVRQMDALLSELQDWSLRLGQQPLGLSFPRHIQGIQDVWLDPLQQIHLNRIISHAQGARHMVAQSRSLTIFLDWMGLSLDEVALLEVAEVMVLMRGQVRQFKDGYRLVFPSSLTRMRVVPFMLKGQRYAVAAAQFVQFNPLEGGAEGSGKILLRAGQVTKSLEVDRVLASENANISPIPQGIDSPDWLAGVIVDLDGEVCLCVAPV
jgi:hypothetical protein